MISAENIIITTIFLSAIAYIVRRLFISATAKDCNKGCGCEQKLSK